MVGPQESWLDGVVNMEALGTVTVIVGVLGVVSLFLMVWWDRRR